MQKCLGIYIEDNLIKYAKVLKDNGDFKTEAFGMKFYDGNISTEIKKIIDETFSFNTPISINLNSEKYLYYDIFSLLSKQDIQKSVVTEFQTYCDENKYNSKAFETRHALVQSIDNRDKIKAIQVVVNKIELNKQKSYFTNANLARITPIGMAIASIGKFDKKENVLIINMEDQVTLTTIYNNQIYDVETLEIGAREILEKINRTENSMSKAYEICKGTTIYTSNADIDEIEQPYLEDILPVLYQVSQRMKEIVDSSPEKISTVYLTGTLSSINNIDLYFQEFLTSADCKILKPNIVETSSSQVNIKDYIEVNSAIALAMTALGEGTQSMNFKDINILQRLGISNLISTSDKKAEKSENGEKDKKGKKGLKGIKINISFNKVLTRTEKNLLRSIVALILVNIIFLTFSKVLYSQIQKKEDEVQKLISSEQREISKITSDTSNLNGIEKIYKDETDKLKLINNKLEYIAKKKNAIPNLLNQIMFVVPEAVQLISIKNTSGKIVSIDARALDYDQLGYFISKLKLSGYLKDVVSSGIQKNGDYVTVTIEGNLPIEGELP